MSIKEQISEDLKNAMKSSDKDLLSVLRMVKSAIKMMEIEKMHELNDDETIGVIRSQIKQRKDSIEEYTKYNKDDVVNTLKGEIEYLSKYLPPELSEDEINKKLDEIFEELKPTSIKDMGNVMRKAVEVFGSNIDKSLLSNKIKERLGSL